MIIINYEIAETLHLNFSSVGWIVLLLFKQKIFCFNDHKSINFEDVEAICLNFQV